MGGRGSGGRIATTGHSGACEEGEKREDVGSETGLTPPPPCA
jgi:hypothetical protein